MKNRTVLLYMTFVFLSNFSTILYFLTVYLEFVGFSMVAISSMMIAYQVSKFILEVPTGYIALDYRLYPNTSHIHPHMCG